ncbi:MAG: CoA-binding protein, partial [Chloroflexi bacterium]|nr:CoA-binding protein [Chloroflexota bacterium]
GGRFLRGLVSFGYAGKLYPVNPQESQILGLKTYSRVGDIPGPVDFATITVPARAVPEIVEECLTKGIKAVQILTAGFKEISEEGRKLEEQLTRTAAKGIRIIGPNCFGVYCPGGGLTILPGEDFPRESGTLALLCQSGGFANRVTRRASSLGVRFSKVISYGNACDVNECDLVEYLGEDPETRIITAYLEGVKDGRRFFKLLQRISQTKPVIIYKGGLTRSGARAVHSHTGSLGGEAAVWEAVFKQTAAIGVNNIDELLDAILAFHHLPSHRGRRVAVVGGGGGVSAAAADTCEKMGLSLPLFPAELQKKLLAMIPPVGSSARNPVDVGNPSPPPPMLRRVLEAVLTEGDIDTVIVDAVQMSVSISSMKNGDEQYGDVVRERARVPVDAKKKFGKPIVMVLPVEAMEADAAAVESEGARRHARDYYLGEGIPVFLTLERAARALVNLIGYYERRDAVASSGSNK